MARRDISSNGRFVESSNGLPAVRNEAMYISVVFQCKTMELDLTRSWKPDISQFNH